MKAGLRIDSRFSNPYWFALTTEQARFAVGSGSALRYPASVIPFAALETITPASLAALHGLMIPAESLYVTGDSFPDLSPYGLVHEAALLGWQMHLASAPLQQSIIPAEDLELQSRPLTAEDAPAMIALTNLAFHGFFRPDTYRLGRYFGFHVEGELIAMVGERLALPGFRELSAVCTHPAHVGRGYAARLIQHLIQVHTGNDERSFLHVTQSNQRAIALYERLGFVKTLPITFNKVRRTDSSAASF